MDKSERTWVVAGALFSSILVLTIVMDVMVRNIHPLTVYVHNSEALRPFISSTVLQELEWHIHAIIIGICVMFGIRSNSNVRVDIFSRLWSTSTQRNIERIGWIFLAIPFCSILSLYLLKMTQFSFMVDETTTASVGIQNRWIIKGIFTALFFGATVLALREAIKSFRRL